MPHTAPSALPAQSTEPPRPEAAPSEAMALPQAELRFLIGGLAAALCIAALHYGRELLAPLVVAALLAFVMAPAVTRLRRWRVPHVAAVALVVGGALAVSSMLAVVMAQQLRALAQDLPGYQETVRTKLRALRPDSHEGALHDSLRLLGVVEGEIDAARRALVTNPKPAVAVQRVQLEASPETPLQTLGRVAGSILVPLTQGGLVLVLLFFMLLQRHEIRDRVLRLMGNDLGRSGDALNDAARRVSNYLVAQLLVNACYAVPLALGLWGIGVPGAWLWGLMGGVLRFIPYLGPMVAGLCPLVLAFAVDPGWQMVGQTLALVLVLELVLNNVIEPLAYSRNTGVSSMAVLVSAGFWSLMWGTVGLAIATPLTVLLVVLGRHLGPLRILDQLFGSEPVFDPPTRLHQRLISGDVEEAVELALETIQQAEHEAVEPTGSLAVFYDTAALGALARVLQPQGPTASAAHRHRVVRGMAHLLQALRHEVPPPVATGPLVLCIGARNEFDTLSAEMLAHTLPTRGLRARALPASALSADRIGELQLDGVAAVCVCNFNPAPLAHTRFVLRRLRRRQPQLPVLLAAWDASADLSDASSLEPLGGVLLATSMQEALARLETLPGTASSGPAQALGPDTEPPPAEPPAPDEILNRGAQRALDVFGVDLVTVVMAAPDRPLMQATAGLPARVTLDQRGLIANGTALHAVWQDGRPRCVPDVERDATFGADHPLAADGMRCFAGAPLKHSDGTPCGVLALHALAPRSFSDAELQLLERMAREISADMNEALAADETVVA